jgi:hypothetical protein
MLNLTLITLAVIAAAPRTADAGGPPKDWEKWVPESATAVLAIDVEALYRSPLAVREGWAKRHASGTPVDVTSLPATIKGMVVASDLSPRGLADTWRVGLADLSRAMTPEDFIRREGGRLDTLRGQKVVVTPRDLVLVPLSPTLVAARQPADRQALGRWIDASRQARSGGPSVYLQQAVVLARAPVVAAIDLTDAVDADSMRARLKACPSLAGRPAAEINAIADLLAGLRGVTISVRVTDRIEAEIRLDFNGPADAVKPVALPLVQEALRGVGAELDDLAHWSTRVEGAAATVHGQLSEQSFRLAISPFFPATGVGSASPESANPTTALPSGPDPKAATLAYYQGLVDLVEQLRTMKGLTLQTRGRWYREYAGKIDALPVLHVDEELLKLGGNVSSTFRALANLAGNFNNQGVIIGMQQASGIVATGYNNTAYGYGYDRFGNAIGVGYSAPATAYVNNYDQISSLLAVNMTNEGAIRMQTWSNISDALGEMRKKMTLKYQVEFPSASKPDPKKK